MHFEDQSISHLIILEHMFMDNFGDGTYYIISIPDEHPETATPIPASPPVSRRDLHTLISRLL